MRTIGMLACLLLVAGCGGKMPSAEDAAKLKAGMSLAEVEGILGRGKEPSAVVLGRRPTKPSAAVWKHWGNDEQYVLAGFANDKLVTWNVTNLSGSAGPPPDLGLGGPAATPPGKGLAGRTDAEFDLRGIYHFLFGHAMNNKDRLPNSLAELKDLPTFDEELYKKLKAGTYVINFGADINKAQVLAYEKDALANGGLVLQPQSKVTRMTAEEIKAALGK